MHKGVNENEIMAQQLLRLLLIKISGGALLMGSYHDNRYKIGARCKQRPASSDNNARIWPQRRRKPSSQEILLRCDDVVEVIKIAQQ